MSSTLMDVAAEIWRMESGSPLWSRSVVSVTYVQ
jgi:hypothetical protein